MVPPCQTHYYCRDATRISDFLPDINTLFQGSWQGFTSLGDFNIMVARIATASFMAYVLGQIMDVSVFNRLRQQQKWWVAPSAAMFFGNLLDTLAFFFIAFYRSTDTFMATNWVEIALVDYVFKLTICMFFFLPAYGVLLNFILRYFFPNKIILKENSLR